MAIQSRPRRTGSARTLRAGLVLAALVTCLVISGSDAFAIGRGQPQTAAVVGPMMFFGLQLRTVCLALHVGGLVLGMGGAVFLDLYLLRHLYRQPVNAGTVDLLRYGGAVVAAGLVLLWLSGVGFLVLYGLWSPSLLANPKLLAKFGIVVILSVNGMLIHHVAFAWAERSLGRPLLAGASLDDALPLLALGSVSSVSWVAAFALGMVREWNNVVPAQVLFGSYLALLVIAVVGACAFHVLASRASREAALRSREISRFDAIRS